MGNLLHYALVFLVVALIAAAVGFGGVAGFAMEAARLLFWVFIVLFVICLVAGLVRRALHSVRHNLRKETPMRASIAAAFALALMASSAPSFAQAGKDQFVTVQPAGQWLASQFIGQAVTNDAGENVGNINDLLFDKSGRIDNVVIGVGGFLGIGEKDVAMPYSALSITADASGKRVVKIAASKDQLKAAPDFKATEKTVYMRAKERTGEMGEKTLDKVRELKDKATGAPKTN
jgi:uncharacterized membrane protein YtjA (UPF0391 family)/sporulation protein YlmC with PRC-barrel domain